MTSKLRILVLSAIVAFAAPLTRAQVDDGSGYDPNAIDPAQFDNGNFAGGNFQDQGGGRGGRRGGRGGFGNIDLQALAERLQANGVDVQNLLQQLNTGEISPNQLLQQLLEQGLIDQDALTQLRGNNNNNNSTQYTVNQLRLALSSPDDEWLVIGSKVSAVVEATDALTPGNNRGGRGGGGGGGGGAVSLALYDLRETLQGSSTNVQIQSSLDAYRKAKEAAVQQLQVLREDLRVYLTIRQEAVLVAAGYLD